MIASLSLKSDIARVIMLALAYYLAARLGDTLALNDGVATLFWPPPGIALAAVLLYGRRLWPGIFIGAFFATLPTGLPVFAVAAIALGNTLAVLFGAFLLRRQSGFNHHLNAVHDVLRLVIFGALISPVISAVNSAFWLQWFGLQTGGQEYGQTLLHMWMGDALGIVLFTPALIAFNRPDTLQWTASLRQSAWLMFAALIVMCLLVFTDIERDVFGYKFKSVMLLPVIIWAALGFNLRITSVALLLIYGFSLFGLFSNAGRFPHNTLEDAVVYNIIVGAIGLCVAVVHEQRSRAYQNLTQSELNFKRAQRVVNMGSWQLDLRSMLFTGSDEVYAIYGLPRDGRPLTQEILRSRVHPDDLAAMDAACQRSLRGEAYDMEQRIIVNGQTKWIRQTVVVDFDYMHKPVGVFGTVRDITRRKLTEESLRLAANVFEGSGEAILITDAEERIVSVNQAFVRMTGYTLDEIKGKNPRILASGKHNADFYRAMWHAIHSEGFWQGEILDRDKSGRIYPKWMSISAIKDEHGALTHYISIAADISERKTAEQNIQSLAYYDVLTGLPNRTLLHDRLGQLIAASHRDKHPFALLFLDLDRFKYINDSMGHGMGDKLLRVVAHQLQQCVREGDTVSRIGGDEFIVLLRETDADGAARVASKILAVLAVPCEVGEVQIATHASIGISIYPDSAADADTLIKQADLAMYRVKEEGRSNYQFFTPEMNFHADKLFSMEKDLRLALERKEFSLYYQPQMNLKYGRICGAEALIRWHHPQKGLIDPTEFISVAEETGQIVPIGEWVLRTACAQLAEWRKQGMIVFPISVNLSIRQLRQPHLAQLVADVLQETGLGSHDLELEITEGIMMGETQAAMSFLNQMHTLGVHLSIDDFGTGYSSLSYLKRMPLDRLKIDQSFVRDITTDENDAAIVRSVISLGHQLNLQVVAEGVETLEQVDFLRVRGCDEIQGHYFSHPLPVNEFAIFINSNPVLVEI